MFWLSVILALSVPIVLAMGLANRILVTKETKSGNVVRGLGIGWQFIRFSVLTTGLPIVGVLALNGLLTSEVATLFAAAMGFAFGKSEHEKNP